MIYLSVIIPAYNEALAIHAGKLDLVSAWLAKQPFATELIVVNDGSHDSTAELARPIANRVISISHAGKAPAIVTGMQQACGEVLLFTDMDQATPITEAPKLLDALNHSAEVAIGSRGLRRQGAPLGRYILSWGQVTLRSILLGLKLTDTQCGFKAVTRQAALQVLDHLQLYDPTRFGAIQGASVTSGFDVEFLFVAQRLGYRICEVPVTWNYQQTRRVNLAKDALRGISELWKIVVTDLRGEYPKRRFMS